ncbi:MAG: hypothetical protein LBG58_17145 [Planctomycetaceae bacterium]|jgi:TPR repeat protein|nr:hypothetical protein [Planctomycetaceae bacterium]
MKNNLLLFVSVCLLLFASNVAGAELRTWTAGTYKVEAEFVSFDETAKTVRLKTNNGKNVAVALDKLSNEDQLFVESQNKKQDENPFKIESQDNPISGKLNKRNVTELNELTNLPIDVLIVKAEKGDADAQLELAIRYYIGDACGIYRNNDKAVEWCQKGAKHADTGSVAGLICKGVLYDKDFKHHFNSSFGKDLTEMVDSTSYYRKAAETGDPRGQLILGLKLIETKDNKMEGIDWIKKSVEQRYTPAYLLFGLYYRYGGDDAEAFNWVHKAAEKGDVKAMHYLGYCYDHGDGILRDNAEAIKWYRKAAEQYRKAAEQGHIETQCFLGELFYNNEIGDEKEAVKWFRKAAEQGFAPAQDKLGRCYELGNGVPINYKEAIKWYRKAAEQGYAAAQRTLGDCYKDGEVVDKDYAEALKWYHKAYKQSGSSITAIAIGDCYFNGGFGISPNYTEAVKWYREAANDGYRDAEYRLGNCYLLGHGVAKDKAEAVKWFRKAAKQKHKEAIAQLKELEIEIE